MASIRQRDGRWQARITLQGFPPIAKTFSNKADAQAWGKITESEMIRGIFIRRSDAERTTLYEALERYEREVTPGKRGANTELPRIAKWKCHKLAKHSLAALRPSDFASYRDTRINAGAAPSTARLELAIISHLFNVARKEWGFEGLSNPIESIRMPKVNNARDRLFNHGEEQLLLAVLSPSTRLANGQYPPDCRNSLLKPFVQLALETAMRRGELLSLTWENTDLDRRVAHLPLTKNGQKRDVPLSTKAVAILNSLPAPKHGEVFKLTANAAMLGFNRAIERAKRKYKLECAKTGTPIDTQVFNDLHFHDLRHIAVTRLAEKLPNIVELAAVSGHTDVRMLKRYYHPRAEDLAKKLG